MKFNYFSFNWEQSRRSWVVFIRDVNSNCDKPVDTSPSPLSLIFEHDRSGYEGRLCHEEIQPPLLSVRPEGREVRFAGQDEEEGEDKLEDEVLDKNDSYHLQVEEKPPSSSEVVRKESVVNVDQDNQEQGLVQSDHIMILSRRDGQSPLFPMHSNRHHENKHQSTSLHPKVSVSYRIRILNGK